MKTNYKNIGFTILGIMIIYITIATYLLYSDYSSTLQKTIKTSDYYAMHKAEQIASYVDVSFANASTLSEVLASAKKRLDYNLLPFAEDCMKNFIIENDNVSSITVTWEFSAVCPNWTKPYGRLVEKSFMHDGLPNLLRDTVDLDGEYVSENYFQLKNGAVHVLFTNPYNNNAEYISKNSSRICYTIDTRIMLDGVFIGMISIEHTIDDLYDMLKSMPLDYAGRPFIVANNGKIFGHSNSKYDNTLFLDAYYGVDRNNELIKYLSDGIVGSTEYADSTHLTLIPIYVRDNGRPWTLVSEVGTTRIFRQSIIKVSQFFILTFFGLAAIVLFTLIFVKRNTSPLKNIQDVIRKIDLGEYDKIHLLESADDEIQECYDTVNTLALKISKTSEFANSMGQGDLNIQYNPENPNALDIALLNMQKNLVKAQYEEENRKKENEKLSWSQNGLAQLGEYLRMNNTDISEFAYNVVSFLVKYLDSLQGGLFVTVKEGETKYLNLEAAYAFDRKKQLEGRVEFGESLVGRCAIEKKSIFLTDVPDGYLYITSGLGENKPKCILLVPLVFEDEVHGVIEIASLNMIEKYQQQFLENVAERIASTISNIKKNINSAELLEKFRQQSDALAIRQREVEQSIKNIDKSRNEVSLKEYEIDAIIDVLSQDCIIMRYDTDGRVTDIRDLTLEQTGYKSSEILGHYLKEILAMTKNDMENFDIFWNEIIQGVKQTRKFTRGETLYRETFSLISDEKGRPYKVISVAVPIKKTVTKN